MAKKLSKGKACEIAEHGKVKGKPLSKKQRGFMHAKCAGKARK